MGNGDSVQMVPVPTSQQVKLAVSPFGPNVPGIPQAHHSSIAIGNLEYSFGPQGIARNPPFQSHSFFPGPMQVYEFGISKVSGESLLKALADHFKEGSYDLLRKNCNSFSDCALFFTLGKRLDDKYSSLERLGADADRLAGAVRVLSLGEYKPNPNAANFRVHNVIAELARNGRKAVQRLDGALQSPRKMAKTAQTLARYVIGQNVQVRSKSFDSWVGATITAILADGGVSVRYESGQFQKDIPNGLLEKHVRPLR